MTASPRRADSTRVASSWTRAQLLQLIASGDDVTFFDEHGTQIPPPALLGGQVDVPTEHLWDNDLASVYGPDRTALVRAVNAATGEPGTVQAAEFRARAEAGWFAFRIHFLRLLHQDDVRAMLQIVDVVEHLPEFGDTAERHTPGGDEVPWVRLQLDAGGVIVGLEGMAEALYGLSAEELIGASSLDFIHPDDFQAVADATFRAMREPGTEVSYAIRITRPDGTTTRAKIDLRLAPGVDGYHLHVRDAALHLRDELAQAIADDQLLLVFQPVVEVGTTRMVGAEALLRWIHPERGFIPPGDFIPVAEMSDSIVEVGAWVLRKACHEAMRWPEHLHVAVNLSVRQLADRSIVKTVAEALDASGLAAGRLVLEVTESALMDNAERAIAHLQSLRDLGVQLAIDDFGTGYSSLQYLKQMPVTILKVDRSFVSGLGHDRGDTAIVTSVIALGHAFGLEVVAEGVETEEQHQQLIALGCDSAQGFLWSRPAPADQFQLLLDRPLLTSDSPAPR